LEKAIDVGLHKLWLDQVCHALDLASTRLDPHPERPRGLVAVARLIQQRGRGKLSANVSPLPEGATPRRLNVCGFEFIERAATDPDRRPPRCLRAINQCVSQMCASARQRRGIDLISEDKFVVGEVRQSLANEFVNRRVLAKKIEGFADEHQVKLARRPRSVDCKSEMLPDEITETMVVCTRHKTAMHPRGKRSPRL